VQPELSAGRVLQLREFAEKLVEKDDDVAVLIFQRIGEDELEVAGVYNGKNIRTLDRGGPIDILKIARFVPDYAHRLQLDEGIRETLKTERPCSVRYVSIANGTPQLRSILYIKHTENIVIGIVRRLGDANQEKWI